MILFNFVFNKVIHPRWVNIILLVKKIEKILITISLKTLLAHVDFLNEARHPN